MRSSSGPGIVSATFAVAMKTTSRQVELDVEVVVAERVVLRRVEHLEQRRRRVAAPVGADLVDLVEHDHRVHRPGVAQGADEPARQRADVGAPVAADLGLVADAAERHAHELAAERARDRLADRGLAGAGRPDQRQDRAGALVLARCRAPGAACARRGTRRCGPSRPRGRRGRRRAPRARASGRGAPRSACPTARRAASRGRCGSSRPRREASPMRSSRPSSRSACSRTSSGMPASSIFVRYSSTTEPSSSPSSLRIDSICLRRKYSRCCFCGAGLDVVADAAAHLQLGQPLALEAQRELEPLGRRRASRAARPSARRSGRASSRAGVGERAGLGDRAQERARCGRRRRAARGSPRRRRGTRARARACLTGGGRLVGLLLDLDAQAAAGVGLGGAERGAVQAGRASTARPPPGRRTRSTTSATVPTLGVRRPRARARAGRCSSSPDVERQGHRHVREDDGVVQRDEQELWQSDTSFSWFDLVRNFRKCSYRPVVCGALTYGIGTAQSPGRGHATQRPKGARADGANQNGSCRRRDPLPEPIPAPPLARE